MGCGGDAEEMRNGCLGFRCGGGWVETCARRGIHGSGDGVVRTPE